MEETTGQRLVRILDVKNIVRQALAGVMSRNPARMDVILDEARNDELYSAIDEVVIRAYSRQFDDATLSLVCDFLDSDAGRQHTTKMSKVNAEITAGVINELIQRML